MQSDVEILTRGVGERECTIPETPGGAARCAWTLTNGYIMDCALLWPTSTTTTDSEAAKPGLLRQRLHHKCVARQLRAHGGLGIFVGRHTRLRRRERVQVGHKKKKDGKDQGKDACFEDVAEDACTECMDEDEYD